MVEKYVGTFGDMITVYNALTAVEGDPKAFGRVAASWSPDLVYKALQQGAGSAFIKGNYFIGLGINLLDPSIVNNIARGKLANLAKKMFMAGWMDTGEFDKIHDMVENSEIGDANRALIMIRLKPANIERRLP